MAETTFERRDKDKKRHKVNKRLKDLSKESIEKYNKLNTPVKGFIDDYLYHKKGVPRITSGLREKEEGDKKSHHHKGNAVDFGAESLDVDWLMNTREGLELMVKHGVGLIDETNPEMLNTTKGTGKHFHVGIDHYYAKEAEERLNNFGEDTPTYLTFDMFDNKQKSQYLTGERDAFVTRQGDNKYNFLGPNEEYNGKKVDEKNTKDIPFPEGGFRSDEERQELDDATIKQAVSEALLEKERLKDKSRAKLQAQSNKEKEQALKLQQALSMFEDEELSAEEEYNSKVSKRQQQPVEQISTSNIPVQQGLAGIQSHIG